MDKAIIATESMALIIVLILLYANCFETKQRNRKRRIFTWLLIANILTLGSDIVSWIIHGTTHGAIFFVLCLVSIICAFLLFVLFSMYLAAHLQAKTPQAKVYLKPLLIYSVVATIWILVTSLTGKLFTTEGSVFHEGPLYPSYFILLLLAMLYILVVIIRHGKILGLHDTVAAILYLVFPLIGSGLSLAIPKFPFAYPLSVLALLIIYVMLQSEGERLLLQQQAVVSAMAKVDSLTGLPNRNSYTDKLDSINPDSTVGVVFCDLNGLKFANDNSGHAAGDKLLCALAEAMTQVFRRNETYRISGDEFIVLAEGISKEALLLRVDNLKKLLNDYSYCLAAAGSAIGKGAEINNLITLAEERMYDDKRAFYASHPEMIRK